MHILYIAHDTNLGGASRSMLDLIDALNDKIEYFVVLRDINGPFIDELRKKKISYFYIPYRPWMITRDSSPLKRFYNSAKYYLVVQEYNWMLARKLQRIIRNLDIDIIHTNASTVNIGALLHKMTGIPHIWHIREFGQEDHGMYPRCSEKKFYKFIDRESDSVVTVSKALARKYEKLLDMNTPHVIYNGVGMGNIINEDRKESCEERSVQFLISGSINEGKGQHIAVRACQILLNWGVTDFNLHIAGGGCQVEWLKKIEGFQDEHIIYHGIVDDMVSLRNDMDVELVCSRCEAFGRVTAEAMMGCIPVIGSDSGGTPELIEDGVTGFLFEKGNAEELAEKMRYFICNREKISEMGQKAQKYALEHFTIERCADEIYEEYCTILKRGGVIYEIVVALFSLVRKENVCLPENVIMYDNMPYAHSLREGGECA